MAIYQTGATSQATMVATIGGGTIITQSGLQLAQWNADTKQDVLTPQQLANIADVQNKQNQLTITQINNINRLANLLWPASGEVQDLQTIINNLYNMLNTGTITYYELAAKGITYADVALLNATYFAIISDGKNIF